MNVHDIPDDFAKNPEIFSLDIREEWKPIVSLYPMIDSNQIGSTKIPVVPSVFPIEDNFYIFFRKGKWTLLPLGNKRVSIVGVGPDGREICYYWDDNNLWRTRALEFGYRNTNGTWVTPPKNESIYFMTDKVSAEMEVKVKFPRNRFWILLSNGEWFQDPRTKSESFYDVILIEGQFFYKVNWSSPVESISRVLWRVVKSASVTSLVKDSLSEALSATRL